MDAKQFEQIRARVLAKKKPPVPLSTQLISPTQEPTSEITNTHSSPSCSMSLGCVKVVDSQKRKAPLSNNFAEKGGSSSSEAPTSKKIKAMTWPEIETVDISTEKDFTFDTIDSLWYRDLDYGSYLKNHLVSPNDLERNKEYIKDHGALCLVKSSMTQIIRSTASILSTMPTLAQPIWEHAIADPKELEKLHKDLEAKSQELADRDDTIKSLQQEKEELKVKVDRVNKVDELLLLRDKELLAEQKNLEREKAAAVALERSLHQKILNAEDLSYEMYQCGFDQAIAQVQHFNSNLPLDISKVNRDKKLEEIIEELSADANQGTTTSLNA